MNSLRLRFRPAVEAVYLIQTIVVALLSSNLNVYVNAEYPSTLLWSDCGQDKCASLEFCKDGSKYGKPNTPVVIVGTIDLLLDLDSSSLES